MLFSAYSRDVIFCLSLKHFSHFQTTHGYESLSINYKISLKAKRILAQQQIGKIIVDKLTLRLKVHIWIITKTET